jgi:hypothetical protein
MYLIKLKNSEMYLEQGESYTPNIADAQRFDDFAEAKSFCQLDEEAVAIEEAAHE